MKNKILVLINRILSYKLKVMILKFFNRKINIIDNEILIEEIRKGKSIVRFGDGEFDLIKNKSIGYQNANMVLAKELLSVLHSETKELCICIPSALNPKTRLTNRSINFWFKYFINNRDDLSSILIDNKYYDSLMTRCHSAYENELETKKIFDFFRNHFVNKKILVVEGSKTNFGLDNDLLTATKLLKKIKGPPKDSYKDFDRLCDEISLSIKKYSFDIIIFAIGPTSKILVNKFILSTNIQLLDLGHMDIEYEWYVNKICKNKKVPVKSKWVNEVCSENGGL